MIVVQRRELFNILNSVSFIKGSACFSNFVGIGSSRHVDNDEEIREVSSGWSIGVKEYTRLLGCYRSSHSGS